ncbi:MAG: flagellar hook-associated protein FlgK [Actinomycetes bacterium]
MSSFAALSVALSGLQSQRRAMEVGGQNVANANTVGYTRQRAELSALGPAARYSLQGTPRAVGNGVEVKAVVRLADEFAMARLRGSEADASFLSARSATLNQIETRFNEPGDDGLNAQLSELWAAWGDVGKGPGDTAARGVLLQQAQAVVNQVAAGYSGVSTQWSQLRDQTVGLVSEVNATASSVADLNKQIAVAAAVGAPVSELADERDRLTLKLSQLSGATVRSNADGTVDVLLGTSPLVSGPKAGRLQLAGAATIEDVGSTPPRIEWVGGDGSPVTVPSGRVAANLESLSATLPKAAKGYDDVAQALADTVNTLHVGGYDLNGSAGQAFFTGRGAMGIRVAITDPALVAASASADQRLDGSLAYRIGDIANDSAGPDKVWQRFVVDTGVEAQATARRAVNAEVVRKDAEAQWTSTTSVDVDEEMVNLVAVQRAYEGAARMLTAVDQALDTLINRTGLVGR